MFDGDLSLFILVSLQLLAIKIGRDTSLGIKGFLLLAALGGSDAFRVLACLSLSVFFVLLDFFALPLSLNSALCDTTSLKLR